MAPGAILCIIGVFILLKRLYRDILTNQPVKLRKMREIALWKLTASRIHAYDGEEAKIVKKKLEDHIRNLVPSRILLLEFENAKHLTVDWTLGDNGAGVRSYW